MSVGGFMHGERVDIDKKPKRNKKKEAVYTTSFLVPVKYAELRIYKQILY